MKVRALPYDVVDVFADAPFAGNQLAVVHGAVGLSDAQLLGIAREFAFSETTFPGHAGAASYDVRIFTPAGEIPFAGHPTLGTAWVLRENGVVEADELTQRCAAGEVGVRLDGDLVELAAVPGDVVGPLPSAVVAALLVDLGLSARDRAGEAWVAGTGLDFVHLPVTEEAVVRARPGHRPVSSVVRDLALTAPLEGVNLFAVVPGDPAAVHSRVFVPGLSVPEDPATGSAATGLGLALRASGLLVDGGRYEIRQGLEMGRPSRLFGRVGADRVHVAGRVYRTMRGTIDVPVDG
jgi:trans-2,3-dihydro-3-hydroxyanthranilate isomerase